MSSLKNNTHTVSKWPAKYTVGKFRRSKCNTCKKLFPLSKQLLISSCTDNDTNAAYCSLKCLPNREVDILNCSVCNLIVKQNSIFCFLCTRWVHQSCAKLTDDDILKLSSDNNDFLCFPCKKDIFPFMNEQSNNKKSSFKPPFWFNNKKMLQL